MQQLANEFGTSVKNLESWINHLKISKTEIDFALNNFDESKRYKLIACRIRPMRYLLDSPELINHFHMISEDDVKNLSESVFIAHWEQLKKADRIDNEVNGRSYPYDSYDAQILFTLRYLTKKTDVKFVFKMLSRKTKHHSYPSARAKLSKMARSLAV